MSTQKRHGYEIMQCVQHDSRGVITVGPGTLYSALKRLLEDELISELESDTTDTRRRYYMLTSKGSALLQDEITRFMDIIEISRKRGILTKKNNF